MPTDPPRPPPLDPSRTPLADPAALPAISVVGWGRTLVVSPHADDESLGCGGAIALLHGLGVGVSVVVLSDGTKSHPNSRRHPAGVLRALREAEAAEALAALGAGGPPGAEGRLTFLGWPDAAVPGPDDEGFAVAVEQVAGLLRDWRAATILVPWRRDPHCDHRAGNAIARAAAATFGRPPRFLEYPVWAYASPDPADAPGWGEGVAWRLDVGAVLARKRAAVAAHRSQTTGLIDDDPGGFRLSAAMLAHFDQPWEIYLESPE